jgi:cytochrome c biogenesis protein CcdA
VIERRAEMRYGIAVAAAIVLIVMGIVFVRATERALEQRFRRELRAAAAAGELPAGIDPERAEVEDFGIELLPGEMWRMKLAHALAGWRYGLIAVVLGGSLAIAWSTRGEPGEVGRESARGGRGDDVR